MWFLQWLGNDVAPRELVERAVVCAGIIVEHRRDAAHRIFPALSLVCEVDIKRFEFCPGVAFTHPEFNTSLTQEIEGRHTLSDAGRMVGCMLDNAMRETNVFRPLGRF